MARLPARRLARWLLHLLACLALLVSSRLAVAATQASQCTADAELPASFDRSAEEAEGWVCEGTLVMRRVSHLEIPICLSEGASAIAPLPLIPTDGAAAEAAAPCPRFDIDAEWTTGGDPSQLKAPKAPPDAMLAPDIAPHRLHVPDEDVRFLFSGGPAEAHPHSVYRPPRG